jgi:hypothetical protein
MKEATKRSIFRWIHIVFAIPILGYINIRLKTFRATRPLLDLSSFLCLSFLDCGCGKAMSFDDLFRKDRLNKIRQRNYSHENGTRIGGITVQ